jgi:PAS domain S-box-containing protein
MFEDVTARKEAEETFQNLAERSPNMIFINRAGRVVYANTKSEEIMGYSREEICSPVFDFAKLVAPEYHAITRDHFQKHMRGLDVPSIEYVIIAKDGTRIPAMISTKLIQYNGQPAILGIVTDVSQLKHAEARLRESAAKLQEQKRALEEKNAALKEVLAQIESEKLEIKRQVTANAEKLLLPILHKMKRKASPTDRRHLDLLESNVRDLTSRFGSLLSSRATALSVRETEIANMIKSGLSSKEIAQLLQVSIRTVDTYRNRIRKKLGISRKRVNLSSHLQTLV